MRNLIALTGIIVAASIAWGCGGKDKREGDADSDVDAVVDTVDDTAADMPGDGVDDPDAVVDPDAVEDPVEDPVEDGAADPDAVEDPADETDVVEDPGMDPDEDVVDDPHGDSSDVSVESTCGGTPYLYKYDKGSEFTSGGCNPDGSTTEALAATDVGGCCIEINHYCAWMNGCSTLTPTMSYTTMPKSVTITETETGATCTHEGWFSPVYAVCGLSAGSWTVWIGSLSTTVVVTP